MDTCVEVREFACPVIFSQILIVKTQCNIAYNITRNFKVAVSVHPRNVARNIVHNLFKRPALEQNGESGNGEHGVFKIGLISPPQDKLMDC